MNIHFIGIGGIGVSALARYYLKKGYKISGSDLVDSEIIKDLKKMGAKIFVGEHKRENVPKDTKMIIYSPAINFKNPELKEFVGKNKKSNIRILSYPEALGELTKKYFTIAVCGSHGKSTTSSMIGLLLIKAGFDPTVIIGTKLKEFKNSNFREGKGKYLVIEADEWHESFLNYFPKIIIITNIDKEHLDYYKNFKNVLNAFKKFAKKLPKDGVLILNKDDKNILKNSFSKIIKKTLFYSLKQEESEKIKKILKIPGKHNISNALAVLVLARALNIDDKVSFKAISQYKGSWRRFEEKKLEIKNFNLRIISDYGHHPTEIEATLKAAREKFPKKRIWLIFQPHQYQRTYYLFNDFVKVFLKAPVDKIIIVDIYDVLGREKKQIKKKVSSLKLVKAINKKSVIYLKKEKVISYLKKNLKNEDVILIMGAGDIYSLSGELSKSFDK